MLFDLHVGRGSESGMEASRAGVVEPELGFLWALKYLKQDKVSCFVDLLELKCPGWTLWSSGPGSPLCPLPSAHCPHPLVGAPTTSKGPQAPSPEFICGILY